MPLDPHLHTFYSTGSSERERLVLNRRGQLEYQRTRELLERELPPAPARIFDVGGAAGTYAAWLAQLGYDVTLIDPVPALVDQALQIAAQTPGGAFSAEVGDARRLTHADESADAVLLLGPLYHLVEREDRLRALGEAARVLRPGGIVAAAAISRYAAILDWVIDGKLTEQALQELLAGQLKTGVWDPHAHGFTTSYHHRPDELVDELEVAGLRDVRIFSVEGPSWVTLFDDNGEEPESQPAENSLLARATRCARATEAVPELLGASAHLLAFGRR